MPSSTLFRTKVIHNQIFRPAECLHLLFLRGLPQSTMLARDSFRRRLLRYWQCRTMTATRPFITQYFALSAKVDLRAISTWCRGWLRPQSRLCGDQTSSTNWITRRSSTVYGASNNDALDLTTPAPCGPTQRMGETLPVQLLASKKHQNQTNLPDRSPSLGLQPRSETPRLECHLPMRRRRVPWFPRLLMLHLAMASHGLPQTLPCHPPSRTVLSSLKSRSLKGRDLSQFSSRENHPGLLAWPRRGRQGEVKLYNKKDRGRPPSLVPRAHRSHPGGINQKIQWHR